MNTDNTSISGETIDYGPCAFLEAYDPAKVFSSIDHYGRYAYGNQPTAMHWNLARLAEALLPVLEQEMGDGEAALAAAKESLAAFGPQFEAARAAGLRRKIGLVTEREGDAALAVDLLKRMAENRADFTLTFRRLCDAAEGPEGDEGVRALFADPGAYDAGLQRGAIASKKSTSPHRRAPRRCGWPIPHSSHETTWCRLFSMPRSNGRISNLSKNCWMSCHVPTKTAGVGAVYHTPARPRNVLARPSAVRRKKCGGFSV